MPVIMFGFNWVDVIIVILLTLAAVEGFRIGFLTQMFATIGFFGALFLAGWLIPHILPIHDRTEKSIINTCLVLLAAIYAGFRGFDLGQNIHWSLRLGKINKKQLKMLEETFGSLPGLLSGLALVWLLGVTIARLPFEGLSNSVNDARIVQQLNRILPPVPAVFADFDHQVNPNAQPYVFAQPKPYVDFAYNPGAVQMAEAKGTASVVRITSFGCASIISGSGFVVAPGLVATNAHVIAGVHRPIVKYAGSSYEAEPIVFDPSLDFAVLRVPKLRAPALSLVQSDVSDGTTVAVLGYPGGNYTQAPGLIRDNLPIYGRNIYDEGIVGRDVYQVQAAVNDGSSGSPIILQDGQVAGVIFSKSTMSTDTAYALTSSHLLTSIQKAKASSQRVSTGACLAN